MAEDKPNPEICGIIRPISDVEGYQRGHWEHVHRVIEEVATQIGMQPKLVSEANEAAIIHRTIVSNILENAFVICDVSTLNPNVMLELGLRLAIGKPTIIIKDDLTKYSFDTSPIEHIGYRADMRYFDIIEFKQKLVAKIEGTRKQYQPFLQSFGPIEVPQPEKVEVPALSLLSRQISDLSARIERMDRPIGVLRRRAPSPPAPTRQTMSFVIPNPKENIDFVKDYLQVMHPELVKTFTEDSVVIRDIPIDLLGDISFIFESLAKGGKIGK